jgi:hypothetical protein
MHEPILDPEDPEGKARLQRLQQHAWPSGAPHFNEDESEGVSEPRREERHHARPFMDRAIFDFGRREEQPLAAAPQKSAPCPLCGEPNSLQNAYCSRCVFRLPWASQVEGLPEVAPRPDRVDSVLERALKNTSAARCRYCDASIQPYDRRCGKCKRWLISGWHDAEMDPWQPDFDAWNLSRVRGLRTSGCLSPIIFVVALALWRVLA